MQYYKFNTHILADHNYLKYRDVFLVNLYKIPFPVYFIDIGCRKIDKLILKPNSMANSNRKKEKYSSSKNYIYLFPLQRHS